MSRERGQQASRLHFLRPRPEVPVTTMWRGIPLHNTSWACPPRTRPGKQLLRCTIQTIDSDPDAGSGLALGQGGVTHTRERAEIRSRLRLAHGIRALPESGRLWDL